MNRLYCGRWTKVDYEKYGISRLTCTLERHHFGPYHRHGPSGWMWSARVSARQLLEPNRSLPPEIVREWVCRGVEDGEVCGRIWTGTEDAARAKGWRIQGGARRDRLCPQCAKPDPALVKLTRELERSVTR